MSTIAIITALAAEMGPIVRELQLRRRDADFECDDIVAAVAGMGAARVVATCRRLIETHDPQRLVLAGFAGGLDPFLRPGYVFIPQQVINGHGGVMRLVSEVPKASAHADAHLPTLLSVTEPALDRAAKKRLHERYKAQAVDMESFAVAQLAAEMDLPLIVVRTISDAAKSTIAPWAMALIAANGKANAAAIVAAVLQPWRWRALARLRNDANRAAQSLGVCVAGKIGTVCDAN
jgi:adenosylhomocysteine nucleosidase